jgi:hypothetical protein
VTRRIEECSMHASVLRFDHCCWLLAAAAAPAGQPLSLSSLSSNRSSATSSHYRTRAAPPSVHARHIRRRQRGPGSEGRGASGCFERGATMAAPRAPCRPGVSCAIIIMINLLAVPTPCAAQQLAGDNPVCNIGSSTTNPYHNGQLPASSLVISATDNSSALIDRISTGADGLLINRGLSSFRGAAGSVGLYDVPRGSAASSPYCIPRAGIVMSAQPCPPACLRLLCSPSADD